jgi:Domain of unknown function (DUF4190)
MSYPPPPPPSGPPTGPPGPGYGYNYGPRPNHPQAVTALVLGILSLVVCSILGPFAWNIGARAVAEIDTSNGALDGRGMANAGRICGMIATILMILGLILVLGLLALSAGGNA